MKNYLNILILVMAIISTSCENWLDIKPEDSIVEDDLYNTSEGFYSAINGLYDNISSYKLYGKELSYSFVDVISQQYSITPDNMKDDHILDLSEFDYQNKQVVDIIGNFWKQTYNTIANANNIINNVVDKDSSFFTNGLAEKNMIYGEALAMRAFLHFDMLRLFNPLPTSTDKNNYIPYVDTYPAIKPLGISSQECMEKIISDLEKARNLTATFDTTALGYGISGSADSRFLDGYTTFSGYGMLETFTTPAFQKHRGFRFSYFSITALLARVYQYAGLHEKAKIEAEKVINLTCVGKMYKFNTEGIAHDESNGINIESQWSAKTNLRLLSSLIFAVYNSELDLYNGEVHKNFYKYLDIVSEGQTSHRQPRYFTINTEDNNPFLDSDGNDESDEDIRYADLIYNANMGNFPISGKWYYNDNKASRDQNLNIIPLIRLTEMYYIAAESYARDGNFDKAKSLLETVRSGRGLSGQLKIFDFDEFKDELIRDARREWISEGQLFYLYKRLDCPLYMKKENLIRKYKKEEKLIPIPINQSL